MSLFNAWFARLVASLALSNVQSQKEKIKLTMEIAIYDLDISDISRNIKRNESNSKTYEHID